jgi:hypothetical protein
MTKRGWRAVAAIGAVAVVAIGFLLWDALAGANEADWDAVVVLHTIEYGRAPAAAQAFVDRAENRGKIVVLSTSGGADARIEGVDAISSASRTTDAPARVSELVARIETLVTR